jgi:hypothetical protein
VTASTIPHLAASPGIAGRLDLCERPAACLGQPLVITPERQLVALREVLEFARPPGDLHFGICQPEGGVLERRPPVADGGDEHRRSLHPSETGHFDFNTEGVEDVDNCESGLERTARAVELELDLVVARGVECHQLRGRPGGGAVLEAAAQHDHAAVKEVAL